MKKLDLVTVLQWAAMLTLTVAVGSMAGVGLRSLAAKRTMAALPSDWETCDWPIQVSSGRDFDGQTELLFYWCRDGRMLARENPWMVEEEDSEQQQ